MKKIKCAGCGSTDLLVGPDDVKINKITANGIKKLKKNLKSGGYGDTLFYCLGRCEDECGAILKDKDKTYTDEVDIIEAVIEDYENLNSATPRKQKPADLKKCIRTNDVEGIKKFIANGLDVNKPLKEHGYNEYTGDNSPDNHIFADHHWPMLIFAIDQNSLDVALELIKAGADPNDTISWTGTTPLMSVVGNNKRAKKQFDVVKALIAAGADVTLKTLGFTSFGTEFPPKDIFDVADFHSKKMLKQHIYDCLKK